MIELFKWQEPHVTALEVALIKHGAALDASDTGTGKTICAIETAKRLGLKIYVITKKAVIPTWNWWLDEMGMINDGMVLNYEKARRHGIPNLDNTLYCFDEVHEASGYKTQNSNLLVAVASIKKPVLMLSATVAHTPLKMYAIGYALGLHKGINFIHWCHDNGCRPNPNLPGINSWLFTSPKENMERLHHEIFPVKGSRMRKSEIPDFPEVTNIVEAYDLPPPPSGIAEFRQALTERVHAHLEYEMERSMPLSGKMDWNQMVEVLYDRMETELEKVSLLIELGKNALEEGLSPVIFTNFRLTLSALLTLGFPNASVILGNQGDVERADEIQDFQTDSTRVLLATIGSGGIGISLHDTNGRFPRIAFICPTYSAVYLRQAMGRIHRAGAKSKAINKLVYAARSIESKVARSVAAKLRNLDTLNDGDLEPGLQ